MKKLFTLLTMLLVGIGSMWADSYSIATTPTQVTSITSGKFYVINGIDQSTSNKHFLFDNGTKVTSNNPQTLPTNDAGKFIWKIVGNTTDGYTLQNLQTGKYMSLGSSSGSQISSSSTSQTNGIYFGDGNYATILNSNGQAIDVGWAGSNPTTWSGSTTPAGSRRLQIYEIEVICDIFADDDYNYKKWHINYFDRNIDASEIPAGVSTVAAQSGVEGVDISCKKGYLNFSSSGNHTVTFQWTDGNKRLDILGVDICDESLTVVASDYHAGFTGGNKSNNVYTVNIPSSGNYLVRYFTKMPSSSGNTTNGTITWNPSVSSSDCYTYVLGGTANVSDLPEIVGKTRKSVKVIAGGLLTIADDDFNLCSVQGAGNVVLDADVTLSGGKSTVATGKLIINEGKTLNIGVGDTETNSIANFTSIDLAGQIKNINSTLTLNNVTVPEGKNGVIFSKDMGGTADGFLLDGTTTVNGNLFVCNRWNLQMKVNELAGNGTWTINGTTSDDYSAGTSSSEGATINIGSSPDFTGTIHGNNSNATVVVKGTLTDCTLKADHGTPTLADGAVLDGVILAGSKRISTTGNVTIRDLAGNNLSNTTNNYALVGTGTLNLEGDCDFTKKSDNSDCGCANIGCRSGSSIVIKSGANVKAAKISYDTGDNAAIIVEGTLVATKLHGDVTLVESSVTTLSEATPFNEGTVTVSGNATLNLTNATSALNQAITVADSKTLTIDCASNTVNLNVVPTMGSGSKINFKNATINYNNSIRNLSDYTFTSSTAQFTETGAEYAAGGFTITNIPSGVTVRVKKYDSTEYETVTPVAGTATISHSVEVSDSAAWLDYTFNLSTKDKNTGTSGNVIKNAGNAGESGNNLTLDSNNGYQYTPSNSYNDDGTLKVMSTPWRNITWPTNYTVAVAGNVPDIENGCLVAFGTHDGGYLAILRGDANNKILLVKGKGNNHFETISTMTAANATELSHLVVFTKNGNTFTVYLDGVQKTQVTYSETLGGGFQIGSIHGGITDTGIERVTFITDDTKKAKVFAKAVRVYDYVISDNQMSQLTTEFPYTSYGGKYTRTITEDSNLSATGAWLNTNTQGNVDIPVNAVVDEVIYYPDVEITTDAASTLTVNADMDTENIKFDGAGKLTIASDGTHHINIYGTVTANGLVSVKYGEIDLTAVPVSIGESGSVEFDFSASDFSGVTTSTDYPITGNTSDYGNKVTGVYPSDIYHTFTITYNSTTNSYYLTVGPSVAFFQQRAINLVKPYYDGRYVGTGLGKYTISLGETSYAEMADFGTAVMSWQTLEDCVEPTIAINQPTSAFYRIKSGDKYLQDARKSDSATQRTLTDAAGANESAETIFYLDNHKFIGYKTGYGFGSSVCQTQDTEHLNTQLFTESAEMGKYTIQSQQGTCTSADHNVGYWGINDSDLSREADAASGACWTLEEVTSLPLTLAADSYTSFSAPVPVTIPEGEDPAFYAYIATSSGDGVINMQKVTGDVAANTGLIISTYGREANPSFDIAADGDTPSGNMLKPNWAASKVSVDNYFFAKVNGKYMFTKVTGDGTNYTLPGHKAYLQISGETARIAINWGDDNPTGIEGLQNESVELKDGKYYQNGKVVVVRNGVKYNVAGQIIK